MVKGKDMWCMDCLKTFTGVDIQNAGNVPIINKDDKPAPMDLGVIAPHLQIIPMTKPKDEDVTACEVIFIDAIGNRNQVKINEFEQKAIIRKLIEKRRKHDQPFEYASVFVFPVEIAANMVNLIEHIATLTVSDFTNDTVEIERIIGEAKEITAEATGE